MKKSWEMGLIVTPTLAHGATDPLKAYRRLGNVRELENAVERALILSKGMPLGFDGLARQTEKVLDLTKTVDSEGFNCNNIRH